MSDVVRLRGSSGSGPDEADTMAVSAPSMPEMGATRVGSTVSRYVVLEEVGRGGMGRVLRAYDPKLQREVALKELRDDGLGSEGRQRLVAEARAMAKLSHPNVVAVYDVEELAPPLASLGSYGEVILVMEYVAGQTLKAWLKEERPWRSIIGRFIDAGRGLVAAHQAGLLHRDFKPANVLVSPLAPQRSERPELHSEARGGSMAVWGKDVAVKVTDFGLAKATGASAHSGSLDADDDAELRTEVGTVMGTPRYMAPEQHRSGRGRATLNDSPLTAAADQYAFCVALWEALCGEPPFSGKAMAEAKEAGPPKWPVHRSDTPWPLVEAVLRGLSPRPEDRWPSMEALLEALAWDPARRRARWLLGLGGLAVASVAGVSYQAWAEARAKRCSGAAARLAGVWDDARRAEVQAAFAGLGKSYADDAWGRTERELDAYADDWVAMHTEACEATTVRGEQSPAMMDLRMGCLQRAAVNLQAAVETLAQADAKVVQNAHQVVGDLRPLSRCADSEALTAEVEPPRAEEEMAVEAARAELARARNLRTAGRYQAAQRAVEAAKMALSGVEYGPVQTEVMLADGSVRAVLGQYETSQEMLEEALRLGAQWKQWDAMLAAATRLMHVVGAEQQRLEDAMRYRSLAEGLSRGHAGAEAAFRNHLGTILHRQGAYEEAEAEYRAALALRTKAMSADPPKVAGLHNNLGNVLYAQGEYGEAEVEYREGLALWTKTLGPDHPHVAGGRSNLAAVVLAQGKYQEAEAEFREALAVWTKALRAEHPDIAGSRGNLGAVLYSQGKYAEAETEFREALALWTKTLGPDHPHVAAGRSNLGGVLLAQGQFAEAEVEHRAALSLKTKALGPDHPDVATSRNNLANALDAQGKTAEAEVEYRAALALWTEALGPDHPDVALSLHNLAALLLDADRPAEALPLAELAWARRQQDDIPTEQRAETAFALARLLWSVPAPDRDRTRARTLTEDAADSYGEAGVAHQDELREVQRWLDEHRE